MQNKNFKAKSHVLPKEVWNNAIMGLHGSAQILADSIRKTGDVEISEQYLAYIQLALSAMTYVKENARDKCRVVVISEKKAGE